MAFFLITFSLLIIKILFYLNNLLIICIIILSILFSPKFKPIFRKLKLNTFFQKYQLLKSMFFFKNYILSVVYPNFIKIFNLKQIKLKWRPLFKKSSYYGFYRSNKNQ